MPPAPSALLFVYGTLLRGEPAHDRLATARFRCVARTAPRYTLVDLEDYPGLLPSGTTRVIGELYEVDQQLLQALDEYEGVPELYQRGTVVLDDGSSAQCYFLMHPSRPGPAQRLIPAGDWRRR